VFISSIRFIRRSSTNGPFLDDLLTRDPPGDGFASLACETQAVLGRRPRSG
jgi:hypothetical protein